MSFLFGLSSSSFAADLRKDSLNSVENSGLFGKELTEHNQQADISFSGDRGSKKENFYDLTGHALLKQDNLTIQSENIRMYFSKREQQAKGVSPIAESSFVDYAIANGSVRIVKTVVSAAPAFKANADQMELMIPTHTLILKGNAKFWRGDEFIHANMMVIDLKTNDVSLIEPRGTISAKKVSDQNDAVRGEKSP
jgi:lipopolysaccharide export system protein LptA